MGKIISSIYDDFTSKQNLFSPGFHIPVVSSREIYNENPDYIIILAWRYSDKIISKHQEYLKNCGKFIIPLPFPKNSTDGSSFLGRQCGTPSYLPPCVG